MRNLDAERNVAMVRDGISGDVHEIYYRMPTNTEIVSYQNNSFRRRGKKVESRLGNLRLQAGKEIITGFKKGTLGLGGKAFASDPSDPDHREDWSEQLVQLAPDIVCAVAIQAFEGTGIVVSSEDEGDEEDAEPSPFGSGS